MKLAGLLLFSSDIHSLGLRATEGLMFTDSWHWDLNAESRRFADRFFAKFKKMPTSLQAADYSATMQYLKLVERIGTTEPDKVMAAFKSAPLSDFYAKGVVRPDGRYAHDMYLLQVKSPGESKKDWDYFKVLKTLPGDQVFTTKEESKCALWK
jgi:branched-chain amino acid transport system substrate-binding protein